ncbi:MAG TPA: hypothetical protein VFH69_04755, partial [Gemmatimonadota bacterium]|nr:hypothetical protein [Gemmatimonadota bacterium]
HGLQVTDDGYALSREGSSDAGKPHVDALDGTTLDEEPRAAVTDRERAFERIGDREIVTALPGGLAEPAGRVEPSLPREQQEAH